MKSSKLWLVVAVMLSLALVSGFGCAKKATDASAGAATAPKADPMKAELEKAVKELAANKIFFDFDKFDIKAEYRSALESKAAILKKYSQIKVVIEGHCDERGTNEYNLALGERRAKAVAEYLVKLGVPAGRLQTVSFGEERPACTDAKEACWSQNRRAEFAGMF